MAPQLLEYFLKQAEEMELETGITIFVDGLIIEGITISQRKYYENFWTELTDRVPTSTESRDVLSKVNSSIRDFLQSESMKASDSVPKYIYLKDVRIYVGSTEDFIEYPDWAGELSSVAGFTFATISKEEEKLE
jgi:hypothetical protein